MPYTLAALRTRTRDLLNESTAGFFTDAEIDRWLGDAAWDISGVTGCVEAVDSFALADGDDDYAVPADAIAILHVQDRMSGRGLAKITPSMAAQHSSEVAGDEPLRWYEFGRMLYIEPVPNVTAAGKNLRRFYSRITQDVTLLPEHCQLLAVYYSVAMAKLKDRLPQEAAVYASLYVNGAAFRRNDVYARDPQTYAEMMLMDEVAPSG